MGFAESVPWLAGFAAQAGLRYEPDADERWFRAWEPYATLRVPVHYTHALHKVIGHASLSVARMGVMATPYGGGPPTEVRSWIAIVQDTRFEAFMGDHAVALSSDGTRGGRAGLPSPFAEAPSLLALPSSATGDAMFDGVFATYSRGEPAELTRAISKSLRKLLLSWGTVVHVELRKGGFVLCPPLLGADVPGISWLVEAASILGNKASKREL